jgi:hypothetical protein
MTALSLTFVAFLSLSFPGLKQNFCLISPNILAKMSVLVFKMYKRQGAVFFNLVTKKPITYIINSFALSLLQKK